MYSFRTPNDILPLSVHTCSVNSGCAFIRAALLFAAHPLFLEISLLAENRVSLTCMMFPTGSTVTMTRTASAFARTVLPIHHATHGRIADAACGLLRGCFAKAQMPVNLHCVRRGIHRHLPGGIVPAGAEKKLSANALPMVRTAHKE